MLAITNCRIQDASDLRGIKQIATLKLSGNSISNLNFLSDTPELYRFYADGNKIQNVDILRKYSRTLSELHPKNNLVDDVTSLAFKVSGVFRLALLRGKSNS